jgi:hypothetical protein
LFTHQLSQKFKILREYALIESAISSNRIEGVNVDQSRIDTVILGNPFLKDRANSFQNTFPATCASSQTTTGQIFTSPHIETLFNELLVPPHSFPLL